MGMSTQQEEEQEVPDVAVKRENSNSLAFEFAAGLYDESTCDATGWSFRISDCRDVIVVRDVTSEGVAMQQRLTALHCTSRASGRS